MAQIYAGSRRKQGGKKGGAFFLCEGVKTEIRTSDVDGGGAQDLQGIGGEGRGREEHGENGDGRRLREEDFPFGEEFGGTHHSRHGETKEDAGKKAGESPSESCPAFVGHMALRKAPRMLQAFGAREFPKKDIRLCRSAKNGEPASRRWVQGGRASDFPSKTDLA